MPIPETEVVANGIYANGDELRKVLRIEDGRVYWRGKSRNFTRRDWAGGPTQTAPTPVQKFAADVDRRLSTEDIKKLISEEVLSPEDRS